MPMTGLGMIVRQCIGGIPKHYPEISVDHYVIMANHVHLLLQINTDTDFLDRVVKYRKKAHCKSCSAQI